MKAINTLFFSLTFITFTFAQPDLNVSLVGQLDYAQTLSDVWGYVAPDSTEYAILGVQNGVSIVSLEDPSNPEQIHFIPGPNTIWRDIKTWDEYAYVTNESGGGLLVIDLTGLPENIESYNWTPNLPGLGTLNDCHNIFIDEFGYAYLSGCNMNSGGMLYIDVVTDPWNPAYVGKGPAVYSHDAYARDNMAYSADISNGYFSIHDVSDKANSELLATQTTDAFATHNLWLSDDGNVIFTTDETGDAPVGAYDISDPDNIVELDQFRPFFHLGQGPIPHNAFVWDDFVIVSYYTEGCIIIDGHRPENLIQVGNFDTYFTGSSGFGGVWGAYPFLPSGLILISDQETGLYVLEPNYVRACYLEGTVTDASNNSTIFDAKVEFVDELPFANTDLIGNYATGFATAGSYNIKVSKIGYLPVDTTITLENGEVTILNVALEPIASFSVSGTVTDLDTGEPVADAKVRFASEDITFEVNTTAVGTYTIPQVFPGEYEVIAGKWGYRTNIAGSEELSEDNNAFNLELEAGLEDIFSIDLGWQVTGTAQTGQFELATPPLAIEFQGIIVQPGEDSDADESNGCYITSNITDLQGGVLIGGSTRLTSPVFDLTGMQEPWLSFESWYLNLNTSGAALGNDRITVRLSNGTQVKILEQIEDASLFDAQEWMHSEFNILEEIEPTATMQISFEISDNDFDDISEAGIDFFRVWDNFVDGTESLAPAAFQLKAFPNPSSRSFFLSYSIEDWDGQAQLEVYNLLGQRVETLHLEVAQGRVELGDQLQKGVYIAQIKSAGKASAGIKLIKE